MSDETITPEPEPDDVIGWTWVDEDGEEHFVPDCGDHGDHEDEAGSE